MTQDNYNYRTNPFFLRDQFDTTGKYGIPIIPKPNLSTEDLKDLRFIGFDKITSDQGKHANRMVHFFLYDYKFGRAWDTPDSDIENLKKYRAVLTPDFSMYTEMPEAMLLYNVFRNRWCGAYFASQGMRVIPTVNFGLESSFNFCFEGIEKGSVVAVSTYMVQEKEGREPQKDFFMAGYNEMMRCIEPEAVICYHEPFPEMAGNIIYINYELSSWQHMNDDIANTPDAIESRAKTVGSNDGYRVTKYGGYVERYADHNSTIPIGHRVVKYGGNVVQLGAGSAYGGNWVPKNEDAERYLGEAGQVKTTYDRNGNQRDTKIGEDGRATIERHYTDHGRPDKHSDPHDHEISWDNPTSHPDPQNPINYPNGAPEFKRYGGLYTMTTKNFNGANSNINFESIADFQESMRYHAEVEFDYAGKQYGIIPDWEEENTKFSFYEANKPETEIIFDSSDDLLNHYIGDKKLREIIKDITVLFRSI